jgi:pilus assembly protein CpaE
MFTGVAINASPVKRQITHAMAVDSGILLLQRATDKYPTNQELYNLTALAPPDILLLDLDNPEHALRCLQILQERYSETPVIGIGGTPVQHKVMRAHGVGHFLPAPPELECFIRTLAETIRAAHSETLANLFAFLPAKAGCGASTLALGLASSMAAGADRRVLCLDADLRSGSQALMLGLKPKGSTQAAILTAYEMDGFKWTSAVTRHQDMDLLLSSGAFLNPPAEWSHYFALIRFIEQRYDAILADLPELVNGATEEVVRRANLVFIVTTQEPVALRLAARRLEELKHWAVAPERIRLIVNRWHRGDTRREHVEECVGLPVSATFTNDYQRVRATIQAGITPIPPDNPLGKELARFAQDLLGVKEAARAPAGPLLPVRTGGGAGIAGMLRSLVTRQAR